MWTVYNLSCLFQGRGEKNPNGKIGTRIRIHFGPGSGSTFTERWIRGSGYGSTFPKCGSQDPDPDPCQNEMDPKRILQSNGF